MVDCMESKSNRIINGIFDNIKKNNYKGYDPYDCLNSPYISKLNNKWIKLFCTQLLVYSPVNFRRMLKIKKSINPKGMGLLLSSLSLFKKIDFKFKKYDEEKELEYIYNWLINNANKSYSGLCWGYNFPWQDFNKYIPKQEPSVVCTSFIGHALLDYYETSKNENILDTVSSICKFITNDLNVFKDSEGICFSYSPFDKNIVHNANLLGASFLARSGKILKEKQYIDTSIESYNFSINKQNTDGSWHYSFDPKTLKTRKQLDFHQGYIIDSLIDYIKYVKEEKRIIEKIILGADFYKKQFSDNGKSYWRYPKKWPIDIHNQTQGIITFSKLSKLNNKFFKEAKNILDFTFQNFLNEKNFVYYQIWPFIKNKNEYVRWNNCWMLLALTTYFNYLKLNEERK